MTIFKSIGHFLAKIWEGISKLFDGLPHELKIAINIGVAVTEAIKNFTDSPAADVITALIPGDVDDRIKDLIRAKLPTIVTELKLATQCTELEDPNEIVVCAIRTLKQLDGDIKSAFLHDLSVLIAQVAVDGKLSWADGVYILQWYYDHKFEA